MKVCNVLGIDTPDLKDLYRTVMDSLVGVTLHLDFHFVDVSLVQVLLRCHAKQSIQEAHRIFVELNKSRLLFEVGRVEKVHSGLNEIVNAADHLIRD